MTLLFGSQTLTLWCLVSLLLLWQHEFPPRDSSFTLCLSVCPSVNVSVRAPAGVRPRPVPARARRQTSARDLSHRARSPLGHGRAPTRSRQQRRRRRSAKPEASTRMRAPVRGRARPPAPWASDMMDVFGGDGDQTPVLGPGPARSGPVRPGKCASPARSHAHQVRVWHR